VTVQIIPELLRTARAAHEATPLFVTQVVVGPIFTAVGVSPTPGADALVAGGIAHNGAADHLQDFDPAAATQVAAGAVLGRPLHEVAGFLAAPGAVFGPAGAATWDARPIETRVDLGAAALNAALNAALASISDGDERPLPAAAPSVGESPVTGGANVQGDGAYRLGTENGITLLQARAAGRRLVAVGRLPYLDRVRAAAAQSWVLETEPQDDDLPMAAAADVLPQADVVGMVGTALVDGVLEDALALCRRDAYVLIVGPSAPLAPALFRYGASALSGSVVDDPGRVLAQLRVVHSGPTPRLAGMRPVTLHALHALHGSPAL
jgi:hypothetical protein